ncbi:hypothetical protein GCM10010317_009870 [Streptomyces mirabilis]|nr:hypothetical protein GCM10010317_009870 [Streptomyces mirabilis]
MRRRAPGSGASGVAGASATAGAWATAVFGMCPSGASGLFGSRLVCPRSGMSPSLFE